MHFHFVNNEYISRSITQQNYCRFCLNFFCCKTCRLEHEQEIHGIHPECEICVYGRTYLKDPSESLLCHFKTTHWPLHCVLCRKVFTTIKELASHSTCTAARKTNQENLQALIQSPSMEPNYDSPPITATMHKSILSSSNKHLSIQKEKAFLTTSTPMQKNNEKELLEQIPEIITPVDYPEKIDTFEQITSIEATKSNIKSVTNDQFKSETSIKRRVTFSEIEIINYQESNELNEEDANCSVNEESNAADEMYTDAMEGTYDISELYTTVPEEESIDYSIIPNDTNVFTRERDKSELYTTSSEEFTNISAIPLEKNTNTDIEKSDPYDLTASAIWSSAFLDSNETEPDVSKSVNEYNITFSIKQTNVKISRNSSIQIVNNKQNSPETAEETYLLPLNDTTKEIRKSENAELLKIPSTINNNLMELNNRFDNLVQTLPCNVDIKFEPEIYSSTVNHTFIKSASLIGSDDLEESIFSGRPTELEKQKTFTNGRPDVKFTSITLDNSEINKLSVIPHNSQSVDNSNLDEASCSFPTSDSSIKSGIWSSVTNVFKTVVSGLSRSPCGRRKRKKEEDADYRESYEKLTFDTDTALDRSPIKKRIKLTNIQCRRTIRNIRPFYEMGYGRRNVRNVSMCDKATQTDF